MRQREVYEAIAKLLETGEPAVLATVVRVRGSSPGAVGSKMLISSSGRAIGTVGGGCVDGQVFSEAKKVFADDTPRQITVDLTDVDDPDHALICGGKVDVFLEPLVSPSLYVCGAGHVGQALARVALPLGFRVTVIDDRGHFLNEARFPGCERIVAPFSETLAKLEVQPPGYVAVVTRGHAFDQECLEWALRQPGARYVGLIGSRVKIDKIKERAREKGIPEDALGRLRAPIGLAIGAVSVEEIAVSIAAELVAVRRLGDVPRTLVPVAKSPGSPTARDTAPLQ